MDNNLIVCPNCQKVGKKQVLGRVMDSGEFMVLRFHHGTTIISSQQYEIVCGCGYKVAVINGVVQNYGSVRSIGV